MKAESCTIIDWYCQPTFSSNKNVEEKARVFTYANSQTNAVSICLCETKVRAHQGKAVLY